MSFILDALRKSDAERQRQSAPGLADIRYARPKTRRSPWVPLLVVVLVANLGFMAFQWWRSGTEPPAAAPGAVVAPPATPAAPVVPAAAVPAAPVAVRPDPAPPAARAVPLPPEVRPLAVEADPAAAMELLPDPAEDQAPGGINDELAAAAGLDADAPAAEAELLEEPVAPAPRAPSRIREEAGLPTSQQLIAAGTLRVPELSLELHVFSDDPAGRFVIINGRRYREGATLNEGPKLESITAEGAVLDSQGTRFIVLPR